jgi:hypothetical protein
MRRYWTILAVLIVAACVEIRMEPSPLTPTQTPAVYVLPDEVTGESSAGYGRTLPAGSRWRDVGVIRQGQVYQPVDTIVTAEGTNVHEAYIVASEGQWVGFWLPYEEAFSPLSQPAPITLRAEDDHHGDS